MPISLRFALRQLCKTPGFTATALATLALCLGANLTIFSVVDAVVVRSLPFPEADRLVTAFNSYPGAGVDRSSASLPNYYDRRHSIKAFSSLSIYQDSDNTVGDAGSPQRVATARVSPEFFQTLGVPLAMGTAFTEAQLSYGPDAVAILTDGYWRNHFGADPNVIGKTFLNDGLPVTVVGVLPKGFRYLSSHAQFYRPSAHDASEVSPGNRHSNNWDMIARLAPGFTVAQAQAQVDAFNASQLRDDPFSQLIKSVGYRTTVVGLHEDHVREVRPMLLLLQCGVVFLLLIGVVNLANLFLIRASTRTKENAVRQALGARAWHLGADIFTETALVALFGGLLGVALGANGIRLIRYLGTDSLPLGSTVSFDGRVAAAALGASALVAVLLAVPTVWFSLHGRLAAGLNSEGRSGTAGRGAQRLRQAFIVVQVALAFVLLSGAGLLSVSLKRVLASRPGFDLAQDFAGDIALPWNTYRDMAPRAAFVKRLLAETQALPGVAHAAIGTNLPFNGDLNDSAVAVEGAPKGLVRAHFMSAVTPEYWAALGIPLLKGRLFTEADGAQGAAVCVVDQAFAARYWPGADPLGRRISKDAVFNPKENYRIVGVVANVKEHELAEEDGHGAVYFPFPNGDLRTNGFSLVVRTALPQAAIAPMIHTAVSKIDPNIPIENFRSMRTRVEDSLVTRRSPAILAGVFAAVALLLSAVGTYGVLSYAVTQRTREIGVRMALGALPSQIQGQFLSIGLRLLVVGTALGILGSWFAGRAMQSILFNVPAIQGWTLSLTIVVMSAVAISACLLPARRAARVDPILALRGD